MNRHSTESRTTKTHHFVRAICRRSLLPLRWRISIAKSFVGPEAECGPRTFAVPHSGFQFHGRIDSHIDWRVFFLGQYDPLGLNLLRTLAKGMTAPVALDIGANCGNHMLVMARWCKQVHCFEPYPRILPQLKSNIESNSISNVCLHEFGLSSENAMARYYENESNNFGAGSFEQSHTAVKAQSSYELELKRGDDIFPQIEIDQIDLIKIDVESHEVQVLQGMSRTLESTRPAVLMEVGAMTLGKIANDNEFRRLFPERYTLFRLSFKNRWTRAFPRLLPFVFDKPCNVVAIPNERMTICQGLIANA